MPENLAHDLESKQRTSDVLIKEDYNFNSLLLPQPILQGLRDAGFCKPSPVQIKAIPLGRCGLDLIVKAKSGTGKTAVFTVIALDMINIQKCTLQVLIIAPTREIAVQIEDVFKTIGKEINGLKIAYFIGGLPLENDIENLRGRHIVVGTPGRLKDLIERGHLNVSAVRLFILDEADKLMEKSFAKDINYIYRKLPERKQILAMSATYPDELDKFLTRYMLSPTFVTPETDNALLLGLRQFVTIVQSHLNVMQQMKIKTEKLICLLSSISFTQCLIFSNYQTRAESISNTLNQRNWKSQFISAAQSQTERLKVMNSLKKFECRVFLTTDLTARGIDASNVDLVINYDVPFETATYLHRMGRAGRYGSKGICVTISADDKELRRLQYILGEIGGSELSIAKLPEGKLTEDLWETDLNHLETVSTIVNNEHTPESNSKLKNSVFEVKKMKSKTKIESECVSEELEKLSVEENGDANAQMFDLENVTNLLQNNEEARENLEGKYANLDSETLLKSLMPSTSSAEKVEVDCTPVEQSAEEIVDPASLLPWIPVEGASIFNSKTTSTNLLESSDDASDTDQKNKSKKRKRMVSSPNFNQVVRQKTNLLTKNVALFNTSDLLTSPNENLNLDKNSAIVESIDKYLNFLEDNKSVTIESLGEQLKHANCKDLLDNIVQYTEMEHKIEEERTESPDALENIFKFGYDFMIKSGPHWIEVLGDKYEETKEENQETPEDMEEQENNYDDDYSETNESFNHPQNSRRHPEHEDSNYSQNFTSRFHRRQRSRFRNSRHEGAMMEFNQDQNGEDTNFQQGFYNAPNGNNVQLVNHGLNFATEQIDPQYLNNPTFNSYYNYYNESLSNVANTLESVPSFNQWFSQWESQLDSLTSYVGQNIYLQEMNNFQYNRWNH